MALRQCDKCSEMVDEAKAFCPACGHAFVEEETKPEASKFEKMGSTVQFGQTMYNQMLEDMGLDISKPPSPVEKRIEMIAPLETEAAPPAKPAEKAPVAATIAQPEKLVEKSGSGSNIIWYILGALAVVVLFPLSVASAILLIFDILSRLSR
ncbi:MAG: hypothetical protein ACKVRN_17035 [Pyrinomonadaceae bacterium]